MRLGFHFALIFHSFSVSILRKIETKWNGKWLKNDLKMDQKWNWEWDQNWVENDHFWKIEPYHCLFKNGHFPAHFSFFLCLFINSNSTAHTHATSIPHSTHPHPAPLLVPQQLPLPHSCALWIATCNCRCDHAWYPALTIVWAKVISPPWSFFFLVVYFYFILF